MTKDFTLYTGSIKMIKELLALGGWANEIVDVYNAGKLIETLPPLPENPGMDVLLTSQTVTLTDKQFNTIAKAIKFYIEKGVVLPTPFAVQLIEQFELLK